MPALVLTVMLAVVLRSGVEASVPAGATVSAAETNGADEARRQLATLRAEVARHDALYHRNAAPKISDYDYDQLKRRLRELEAAWPEIAAETTAVAEVADDRTGLFQTHPHRERMLSLDKTYAESDLRAFHARLAKRLGRDELDFVVEPKLDGLAVSVTYEAGRLVRAVTRGNGLEGDDITANVLAHTRLPRTLRTAAADGAANPIPTLIELRGELFATTAEFARLNAERAAEGAAEFANPRNLAAGTVRRLDSPTGARRALEVAIYGVGACEPAAVRPQTQRALHEQVRAWGLPGLARYWTARGADELWTAVQAVGRARAAFVFPTDGAVVKLDRADWQREMGETDSAPRWAIAFKFAPARAETQVVAITVQVGRTGVLTPVAEFTPVELAGSTVARATLHNRDEIARLDIRVGDMVFVEKAGEIIPAVVGVNLPRRPATAKAFVFPEKCPACGEAVVQRAGEVAVRCVNAACSAQLQRRLEHFASRDAMDIRGLGPATIDALVAKGLVKELPDIYRLRREDLLGLGKDVAKSADALLVAIDASKRAELWRVIFGLGIPQVGEVAAKELARRHGTLDRLAASSEAADTLRGSGGGDAADRALAAYLADARQRELVASLVTAGVGLVAAPRPGGVLAGKVLVLTGTLRELSRAQAVKRIEAEGGIVRDTVSPATTHLVAGIEPGAKVAQAQARGVPVIDEAELLRILAETDEVTTGGPR